MLETSESVMARNRLLKSARLLMAFFEHKLQLSLDLLTEAPAEPLPNGLQFDFTVNCWGLWGLRSSLPLSEPIQAEISATFHGLLGALDSLETRAVDLQLMQQKFEAMVEGLPANVIPLRLKRLRGFSTVNDKRWLLKLDCLIESTASEEVHKMALELHHQSQRYAFVEYSDLDVTTRSNYSELLRLGAMTIFVPSILHLTVQEQDVLRILIQQDAPQRPLLMVGAKLPYSDLRMTPAINLEFLALLSRVYIKLTRPFKEYKDNGLIHYFLDSLSQNPT